MQAGAGGERGGEGAVHDAECLLLGWLLDTGVDVRRWCAGLMALAYWRAGARRAAVCA